MAYEDTTIKRPPGWVITREAIIERLNRFPWWFLMIVIFAVAAFILVVTNTKFNEAFSFIRIGLSVTISTTLSAFGIALLLGLLAGLGRISRSMILRNISTLYVEIIRGIPMLVLIFFIALVLVPAVTTGLQEFGVWLVSHGAGLIGGFFANIDPKNIPMQLRAVIALSVTYGAFSAEIFRAGIQSINKGQLEAARSQGLSYWQAMRYIILPQAIKNVMPALGNDFVSMLKDSSLVSVLAVRDITQVARLYAGQTFRFPEAYYTLAALYLSMTVILSLGVKALEKRFHQ